MESNITSTSDLRVEYEIHLKSIVVTLNDEEIPATLQNKLDTVAAAKDLCLRDIREHAFFEAINLFHITRNNVDALNNELYCELPADATALAEISNSLALGDTQSFNYISDSFAGGITTSSDEQFTPTLANGVSSGASSKTKLKGSNLHFGYAFENFRLTFSDFSWSSTSPQGVRCYSPFFRMVQIKSLPFHYYAFKCKPRYSTRRSEVSE